MQELCEQRRSPGRQLLYAQGCSPIQTSQSNWDVDRELPVGLAMELVELVDPRCEIPIPIHLGMLRSEG